MKCNYESAATESGTESRYRTASESAVGRVQLRVLEHDATLSDCLSLNLFALGLSFFHGMRIFVGDLKAYI